MTDKDTLDALDTIVRALGLPAVDYVRADQLYRIKTINWRKLKLAGEECFFSDTPGPYVIKKEDGLWVWRYCYDRYSYEEYSYCDEFEDCKGYCKSLEDCLAAAEDHFRWRVRKFLVEVTDDRSSD